MRGWLQAGGHLGAPIHWHEAPQCPGRPGPAPSVYREQGAATRAEGHGDPIRQLEPAQGPGSPAGLGAGCS